MINVRRGTLIKVFLSISILEKRNNISENVLVSINLIIYLTQKISINNKTKQRYNKTIVNTQWWFSDVIKMLYSTSSRYNRHIHIR